MDAYTRRDEYLTYLANAAAYFWMERFIKEHGLWAEFVTWKHEVQFADLEERGY